MRSFWLTGLVALAVFSACSPTGELSLQGSVTIGTGSVSGFVKDARDGRFLPGVTVKIGNRSGVSSTAGNYEIEGLAPGQTTVTAVAAHYAHYADTLIIHPGSQVKDILLAVESTPAAPVPAVSASTPPLPPDGQGPAAQFSFPKGIAVDQAGNLYVADRENHRIRKVTPHGMVTTLAGNGKPGSADGAWGEAQFTWPESVAVDKTGNVYVTDAVNSRVRKISPQGKVSTLAGGQDKDYGNGCGAQPELGFPGELATDASGNLYAAARFQHTPRIWKLGPDGSATRFAGQDIRCAYVKQSQAQPELNNLSGLAVDNGGYLYTTDNFAMVGGAPVARILKFAPDGTMAVLLQSPFPFVPTSSSFQQTYPWLNDPRGIALDQHGNILVADRRNHRIARVTPQGEIQTVAGDNQGFADGLAPTARFNHPQGVAIIADGTIYISDTDNHRIRKISPDGQVSTLAGNGLPFQLTAPTSAPLPQADASGFIPLRKWRAATVGDIIGRRLLVFKDSLTDPSSALTALHAPRSVGVAPQGQVYVADTQNHRLLKVNPDLSVNTAAGTGTAGFADGLAGQARFSSPGEIAFDATGNLYLADSGNHRVRKLSPDGFVSTLAGTGTPGHRDGSGTAAMFNNPIGLAIDRLGHVYVSDEGGHQIRRITPQGTVSTFAGSGLAGYADGSGEQAQFARPVGLDIDAYGNLYVADMGNHRVRQINQEGYVTTLAGTSQGDSDGPAREARFSEPAGLAIDADGNLYVTDSGNHRIRKITYDGIVYTLSGTGYPGDTLGAGGLAQFRRPLGIALAQPGKLFIADTGNNRILQSNEASEKVPCRLSVETPSCP